MKLNPTLSLLILSGALLFSACDTNEDKKKFVLPVFGEKKAMGTDTVYHTVGKFSFTNQFGETVNNKTVENKIYVADFFFATCESICPAISTNLKDVQKEFENDDSLLILCHTVNPLHDTVEVLNAYGITYGAKKNKWHFHQDRGVLLTLVLKKNNNKNIAQITLLRCRKFV
jgi:protein SCO1/2